jgi:glycosyltransferase involved in cell wall biosynthesis
MKALFCHDHFYYRGGDDVISKGQYHASVWQRYLDHFDSITVTGRDGGCADKNEVGVNIASRAGVRFSLFSNTNSLRGIFKNRKKAKKLIANLVSNHDVIILRGISTLGAMAFFEAKHQGKTVALEMVSCAWDEAWYHGSLKAKIYAFYHYAMARHITKHTDAVIYVSQSFLQNRYPTRAKLEAKASNVQIPDKAFLAKKIEPKTSFKIGLIGTLKNKLKGVDVAIEAMKTLNDANVTIHILGPGDPAPYQKIIDDAGLSNRIKLDGIRQSGEDVWGWLRTLDLYIQPSFQEGVPRAMIEAMAQGLPVIGSDAGGIPELISTDMIVKRGDAQALAYKIKDVVYSIDKQQSESQKNFKTAQRYDNALLTKIRHDFWGNVRSLVETVKK